MGRTAFTEPQCLYKDALYLNKTYLWETGNKKTRWMEIEGGSGVIVVLRLAFILKQSNF
jgi:hypothetical protein